MKTPFWLLAGLLLTAGALRAQTAGNEFDDLKSLPPAKRLPDDENAWLLLRNLPPPAYFDSENDRGREFFAAPTETAGGKLDQIFVEAAAKNCSEAIKQFHRAMRLPRFQAPDRREAFAISPATELLTVTSHYKRLVAALAVLQTKNGDQDRAWQDILAIGHLGSLMTKNRPDTNQVLTAGSLHELCGRTAGFAAEYLQSSTVLRKWAADLAALENDTPDVDSVLRLEFANRAQDFGRLALGGDSMKRDLIRISLKRKDFDDAKSVLVSASNSAQYAKSLENRIDHLMQNPTEEIHRQWDWAEKADWRGQVVGFASFIRRFRGAEALTLERFRNSLPEVPEDYSPGQKQGFLAALAEANSCVLASFEGVAQIRLARAALAIRAWQLDHGGDVPDRLEQLVPNYLPAVPIDPLDGEPLRFSLKRQIMWACRGKLEPIHFEKGSGHDDGIMPLVRAPQ